MRTIPYDSNWLVNLPETPLTFTAPKEVAALIHFAKQTEGDLVEIGCNTGRTTVALARAFPTRRVFAVDYLGNLKLNPHQECERPKGVGVEVIAAGLTNVTIIDMDSSTYVYPKSVGFTFIDGDHRYGRVQRDTKIAFSQARNRPMTIMWHDVNSRFQPHIVKFINSLCSLGLDVFYIEGTLLAGLVLKAPLK